MANFIRTYIQETRCLLEHIDEGQLEQMAQGLAATRKAGGRLFLLGVGGSAGHASHAVNDFRKICGLEAYAPTDNVSELTARINDEGWDTCFANWLKGSRINRRDGGFTRERATACIVIPPLYAERVTPHTEGICAVLWHLLVSHPAVQVEATKWESSVGQASTPAANGYVESRVFEQGQLFSTFGN